MPRVASLTTGLPGFEVWIEYAAGNRRIQSVQWSIPRTGVVVRARIWRNGQLVFDRTIAGPANGAETVPGNIQLVEVTDAAGTYLDLPPDITYQFNVETLG